jgi:hypothetical protein
VNHRGENDRNSPLQFIPPLKKGEGGAITTLHFFPQSTQQASITPKLERPRVSLSPRKGRRENLKASEQPPPPKKGGESHNEFRESAVRAN